MSMTADNKKSLPELTLKAILLAVFLSIVLSAANAYLGLKVGLTVSSSVPAAIIAMGLLRLFRNNNILENNIVQTAASSGEAVVAGIIFTLPALLIIHYWQDFDYLTTVIIAIAGGVMGVFFTVPLRRALLDRPTLKFPEGTAIGHVLLASQELSGGLKQLVWGGAAGGFIALCQTGFKLLASIMQKWVFLGSTTVAGFGVGFAPALIAAGYIVGVEVAVSTLIGLIIGWILGIPFFGWFYGMPADLSATEAAFAVWNRDVRFVGIGTMLVAGLWIMVSLVRPVVEGIKASLGARQALHLQQNLPRHEQDMAMKYVLWGTMVAIVPIFFMLQHFAGSAFPAASSAFIWGLSISYAVFILFVGFVATAVCAYFAGLVGTSASPISGVLMLTTIFSALAMALLSAPFVVQFDLSASHLSAFVIVVIATMGAVAAISNDTMQDLKAGQIVSATPWKQQLMQIIGVLSAALFIPIILQLLLSAYGIADVFPREGMDPAEALAAPQAVLMATTTKAVLQAQLPWHLLMTGIIIGLLFILINKVVLPANRQIILLALAGGIYLPYTASTPIILGGLIYYVVHRKVKKLKDARPHDHKAITNRLQTGMMVACGLVAGAALMGVVLAIPFSIFGSTQALALVPRSFVPYAEMLGLLVTAALCVWLYRASVLKD
jgi:putative OPT family oligopeptide transporter